MYRVFLSYNTNPNEMVVVWRLQTLSAASGLHLDVPSPAQRSDWATLTQMIDQADSVVVFLTRRATQQVQAELDYALTKGKRIIPIVEQGASTKLIDDLLTKSGSQVFLLDPERPWEMEEQLANVLRSQKTSKESQNALLAIGAGLIGLLLLQEVTKK